MGASLQLCQHRALFLLVGEACSGCFKCPASACHGMLPNKLLRGKAVGVPCLWSWISSGLEQFGSQVYEGLSSTCPTWLCFFSLLHMWVGFSPLSFNRGKGTRSQYRSFSGEISPQQAVGHCQEGLSAGFLSSGSATRPLPQGVPGQGSGHSTPGPSRKGSQSTHLQAVLTHPLTLEIKE